MKKKRIYVDFLDGNPQKKILRIMKLTVILLMFFTQYSPGSDYSSKTKISLNLEDVTIKEVFSEIEKATEFHFYYSENVLNHNKKVNLKVRNSSVDEILRLVFKGLDVDFAIDKQKIIVKQRLVEKKEVQQEDKRKVKGRVTDDDGEPLPGANIIIEGSTGGVITSVDGTYNIEVNPEDKLTFSFIGMEPQTIFVGNKEVINVAMVAKDQTLEDVTVVAFGKQKKESVIGSITPIDPTDLKVPSSNLTTALAGRMAGIISYQRSGEPGQDNAEFFIRGVTTFGYKKDPLILIDGVELTSNDLARLQPDDVQSFSIMKDATATALYGARGANGVILVVTKQGVEGKAKVSIRYEHSISSPTRNVELSDPITYMKLHNEAVLTRDPLGRTPYSFDKIEGTAAGRDPIAYPSTDWYNELFKNYALNKRLNFNISGGGKVARYYISGTANQDNGVLKVNKQNNFNNNIDLKQYVLRSNININITKTTEAIVRFHGTFDDYTGPIDGGGGAYNKVMRSNPVLFPAYYPPDEANLFTNHILFGNYDDGRYINPYADMVKGYRDESKALMLAQLEVKQDLGFITDGLSFRALGNTNRRSSFSVDRFYNPFYYSLESYDRIDHSYTLSLLNEDQGTNYLNYTEGLKYITSIYYLETAIQYNKEFKEKHGVSGLLVYTMREELIANAGDLQKSLPYRNMGTSGRFTYSYAGKYFTEFNFGYNGSERFSQNERFGFFPSAGLAWIVSKEDFWKPIQNVVNNFKLKATYGLVGNDAIGSSADRFFYLSNVNINDWNRGATFGSEWAFGRSGVSISRYENDQITWETAKKANIGMELSLLNSFEINLDVFHEDRTSILMDRSTIPASMGLQAPIRANVGEAIGKGIDLSVNYQKSFESGLWVTGMGNFTYAVGEYKVIEEPNYEIQGLGHLSRVGQKIGQQWGYVAERLFIDEFDVANSPEQNFGTEVMAGDIKYRDINGDGEITGLDMVPIGHPTSPEIVYGFGASLGYKGIDFSFFFQGLANMSFWIDPTTTGPFIDNDGTSDVISNNALLEVVAEDHWSENDRDPYAFYPRLSNYVVPNNAQRNTWFMRDGSFMRLKSLEVGYSFPKRFVKLAKLNSFRLYLSGTNLLTFSKFKLWDPEMGGNGLGYPIQRVFNVGIEASF